MAIFKCKMCGGALEVNEEITVVECDYCGSKQTVPTKKDEVITNLFNRANNLRLKNEFDKAAEVYNKILNENDADAEAHWGLVLCKYGIEYVEDPKTYKRIPTCHRTQYTSVLSDADYLAAIENADVVSKEVYTAEAHEIAELQKSILAIVKDEKPFDVFICYKETDENGKRTIDSALANDIYYQLTKEGLRVFYAAITLEDKLGVEYEPYIFAALNSAKVMLAIGTKPEYFNAVWVKNEWSRYLGIMKTDREKMLIPCYRDMDAYDLPEEFAHLQAQDMSKIGFINDLVRGIKKVTVTEEEKTTVVKETVVTGGNANIVPLLKRVFMFLEDGQWTSANEYCEKVLDIDPECAEAYLGKLLVSLKVKKREELKNFSEPFDSNNHYQKAIRFADASLKAELEGYIKHINYRNSDNIYQSAISMMNSARYEKEFKNAAAKFREVNDFKDSASQAQLCLEKAEEARLEDAYNNALSKMTIAVTEYDFIKASERFNNISDYKDSASKAQLCMEKAEETRISNWYEIAVAEMESAKMSKDYKNAAEKFNEIIKYKDSESKRQLCLEKAEELRLEAKRFAEEKRIEEERLAEEKRIADEKAAAEAAARAKKNKTIGAIVASIVAVVLAVVIVFTTVIIPNGKYDDAVALMEAGKYEEAISAFEALDGHKDSEDKINESRYLNANSLLADGKYEEAINEFDKLNGYNDSYNKITECKTAILDNKYSAAVVLMSEGKYENAIALFEEIIEHKDSKAQLKLCMTTLAANYAKKGDSVNAIKWYEKLEDKESANKIRYDYVQAHKNSTDTLTYEYLNTLKSEDYKDSVSIYDKLYAWSLDFRVNSDYKNNSSKLSSIPQSKGTPYIHYKVSGGYPGQVFNLKIVHETRLKLGTLRDWEVENRSTAGGMKEITVADGWKSTSVYPTGSNLLYHRFTVYDADTGKKLASVTITTPYDY